MFLLITTRENRKYPVWLVRARVGDRWYEITNVLHPRFWADWWDGWRGRRAWALCWYARHLVRRIDPSIYVPQVRENPPWYAV